MSKGDSSTNSKKNSKDLKRLSKRIIQQILESGVVLLDLPNAATINKVSHFVMTHQP